MSMTGEETSGYVVYDYINAGFSDAETKRDLNDADDFLKALGVPEDHLRLLDGKEIFILIRYSRPS